MPDQTPVTDDDRAAHEWCDSPARQSTEALAPIIRAIRAHVPAPPATLADELREYAKDYATVSRRSMLRILADRVEAVEKENRDNASKADQWEVTAKRLASERDEARAEVQRLTSRQNELTTPPDPADVPSEEMWLIRTGIGQRLVGVRCPGGIWSVLSHNGFARETDLDDADVTLVSRLVPDVRRVIDRLEALDALPVGSVVLDKDGASSQKTPSGNWDCGRDEEAARAFLSLYGPVTVIYEPEEGKTE